MKSGKSSIKSVLVCVTLREGLLTSDRCNKMSSVMDLNSVFGQEVCGIVNRLGNASTIRCIFDSLPYQDFKKRKVSSHDHFDGCREAFRNQLGQIL